jgi:hypothetical protein
MVFKRFFGILLFGRSLFPSARSNGIESQDIRKCEGKPSRRGARKAAGEKTGAEKRKEKMGLPCLNCRLFSGGGVGSMIMI